LDAGNIWSTDATDSRNGAFFIFRDLYQSIAINWGIGLRFVFNTILVVRVDYGMQIHNPIQKDPYFVYPRQWFGGDRSALVLGLGYPF